MQPQPGILAPLPAHARYVTLRWHGDDASAALARFDGAEVGRSAVVGFGPGFLAAAERTVPGLSGFPSFPGAKVDLPSTPAAVWLWLRGDDPGSLLHEERGWLARAGAGFSVEASVAAFVHRGGRDLSGYEDGTENPTGDDARRHGVVGEGPLRGSSFVAVQRWRHDFDALEALGQPERDRTIGRRIADNEEIPDAPATAHVKRTAQEDFEPEAFVLRRSMPWADAGGAGLVFVAFGRSLDAFTAQLHRMCGAEDGVVDALWRFTRPETGATFWCPPAVGGSNLTT